MMAKLGETTGPHKALVGAVIAMAVIIVVLLGFVVWGLLR